MELSAISARGKSPAVLVDGLKRLEYRGYDSCGVAIMDEGKPNVIRSVGRIGALEEKLKDSEFDPRFCEMRNRPYPLGHSWPAKRDEFASSSRLHGPFLRCSQRDHRELSYTSNIG